MNASPKVRFVFVVVNDFPFSSSVSPLVLLALVPGLLEAVSATMKAHVSESFPASFGIRATFRDLA